MQHSAGRSLFTREIDRAALTVYFLGALVPLLALAVVVDRYALPQMPAGYMGTALIAAVVCIGVVSIGAFVILRRVTRRTIRRIDGDNRQLGTLLSVARALSGSEHFTEVTRTAAESALEITGAAGAFLYLREDAKTALAERAGAGADALYGALQHEIDELATMAMHENRSVLRAADPADELPFSAIAVPLPGERKPGGAMIAAGCDRDAQLDLEFEYALSTLAALSAVALRNADLRDAQRNFFSHVTDMLVSALDTHLGFNVGHGDRTASLANRLGRELGLDEERLQKLHFAALLHDIGMLRLDRNGQMNPRTCEKHATLGFRMLHRIRVWRDVAPVVQAHHEWWDGSGYPESLAGDAIPVEARIISLCDAVDTMTSDASYKRAVTLYEALEELDRCSGRQFDPEVVAAFRKLVEQGGLD